MRSTYAVGKLVEHSVLVIDLAFAFVQTLRDLALQEDRKDEGVQYLHAVPCILLLRRYQGGHSSLRNRAGGDQKQHQEPE